MQRIEMINGSVKCVFIKCSSLTVPPVLYYGPKNAGAAPINKLETKAMVFVVSLPVTDFDLIKCYGFFLIDLDGN